MRRCRGSRVEGRVRGVRGSKRFRGSGIPPAPSPAILYEMYFNLKDFWQCSQLHEFFNMTCKDRAV